MFLFFLGMLIGAVGGLFSACIISSTNIKQRREKEDARPD